MVTINEPHVTVTDVEKIKTKSYGDAGKIALIGAFPNSTFQIDSFTTLEAAQAKVGAESIPEGCISYGCLEYIFNQDNQSKGAEEVIIYNTNYGKSVLTYTITNGDIANALTVPLQATPSGALFKMDLFLLEGTLDFSKTQYRRNLQSTLSDRYAETTEDSFTSLFLYLPSIKNINLNSCVVPSR